MAFVLIGFMGAGKSSGARSLARALGTRALDSDALLEERFGHPVAVEFERSGEQAFRAAEQELVVELLARAGERSVVALGGGSVLAARVREALPGHVVVLLDTPAERCWERVRAGGGAHRRPLAADRAAFTALYRERRALYEELADAVIVDPGHETLAAAATALQATARAHGSAYLAWATSASAEYPVFVGAGLLGSPQLDGLWPLARGSSRSFAVSDENVAPLYGGRIGELAALVTIPAGERHKTIASAERVWSALLEAGMTRADHVVALGGGVVGDVAGFCAATYQRGVAVVQVPTTLVAQVDSAYGGKTGVDLPKGKNYVGAYHQPAGVIADPATLAMLPEAERAAGWVEVLKTALIAGGALWDAVAAGTEVDERMIFSCVRTKLSVVAADERDAGARQVLNLGHTVGHAIEASTGYGRYRHGEAVGLGLLAALRLSGREQLRAQVRELLCERGLPVRLEGTGTEPVIEAVGRDKKRMGAEVPFVLVEEPGEVRHGCTVGERELRTAVEELTA